MSKTMSSRLSKDSDICGRLFLKYLRVLPILPILSVANCHYEDHYVELSLAVPPKVQQAFSLNDPGLVYAGRKILGRLCSPSNQELRLTAKVLIQNSTCAETIVHDDAFYGEAFAFHSGQYDLQYNSDEDREATLCGQSGKVVSKTGGDDGVDVKASLASFAQEKRTAVASSSGNCNAQGDYVVDLTLALQ
jgi:hypothetical protein